ncbi:hypothetical protein B9Q05_11385 [Candidatus Marsarchaeota G2 archaeon ECH_B_1]|uniref:Uncharacterized protein n=1 Tax=Candidatus Marsarchaeota G2 archaeon ECH_B_1 TaxID=1978159 RepID=A0A2R6BMH6_9ARCH|nr:MAG: hypothetical protein B9Q05_11385 [Candidatus Marsarchaeota G2 archaeon ECH_B_1]
MSRYLCERFVNPARATTPPPTTQNRRGATSRRREKSVYQLPFGAKTPAAVKLLDTLLVGQAALKSTGRGHAHPPNQLLYLYGKEVIKSKKVL